MASISINDYVEICRSKAHLYSSGLLVICDHPDPEKAVQGGEAVLRAAPEDALVSLEVRMRDQTEFPAFPNIAASVRVLDAMVKGFEKEDRVRVFAGTVGDGEKARAAANAGADGYVSHNFCPETLETADRYKKPYIAGWRTPSELAKIRLALLGRLGFNMKKPNEGAELTQKILDALEAAGICKEAGLPWSKFFSAEGTGNLAECASSLGPEPGVLVVPTGGIKLMVVAGERSDHFTKWAKTGRLAAVGLSAVAPTKLIGDANFSAIEANTRLAYELIGEAREQAS